MQQTLRPALAIVAAVLILAASSGTSTPTTTAASYDFAAVDAAAANAIDNLDLAGGVLTLSNNDGVLFENEYGSYTSSTVVPIASASKWLSGAVIMTLVEDGLIDLDAPISTYLTSWTGTKGTITMRQLFSHTSGLNPDADCSGDNTYTYQQCIDEIYTIPMTSLPGAQFRYGGASMTVGGRIAEIVTGQSWPQLFAERIATPLGMTSTGFFSPANPNPAGGGYSNANDYTRFMRMLVRGGELDGQTILTPASVAEMQEDQTNGAVIVGSPRNDGSRYGIGEWRDIVDGGGNAIQLSSPGAFAFNPWLDVQRGYAGVFVVYTQVSGVGGYVNQMQAATRTALVDADIDEVGDSIDNCLGVANPDQASTDRNFIDHSPPYNANVNDKTVPNSDTSGDACDADDDNDGRTDAAELSGGTCGIASNPLVADSDGDRFLDGAECVLNADPTSSSNLPLVTACGPAGDSDGDKLSDRIENCFYGTNPNNTDTDGDRLVDGGKDGCEAASLNSDRIVNVADMGMLASAVSNPTFRVASVDVNKDGVWNPADQGFLASFISPSGQCPG